MNLGFIIVSPVAFLGGFLLLWDVWKTRHHPDDFRVLTIKGKVSKRTSYTRAFALLILGIALLVAGLILPPF
jgi:hypothetical protein